MDLVAAARLDDDIVQAAKDWALLRGLTFRRSGDSPDSVDFIPFILLPSCFPRSEYEAVRAVQPLVNQLMHRVAHDRIFLKRALAGVARVDEFTRRLLELHDEARSAQRVSLGLLRADYMLEDAGEESWLAAKRCKQVEVNTIASGQGWIGTACSRLHRYILAEMGLTEYFPHMPENRALEKLSMGMVEAWKLYNKPSALVLFVVEDTWTQHISDQRQHEYELRRLDPRIRVIRRNLGQIGKTAELVGDERRLIIDGRHEVGLVYMRSGYAPEQYPSEIEWRARRIMEDSMAIKCPSVGYQLAGTKKVQQLLAQPGCLESFLEKDECDKLRRFFTGLYSLDTNEAGDAAIETAIARPDSYVLKPQREGGSNNLFGTELQAKLESMRYNSAERSAWILMDKIVTVTQKNYMVRPNAPMIREPVDLTLELGIFGVVLGDEDRIFQNETSGHTLRTKLAECNEGGVSKGFGACDSPLLI